jgi:hypothetical protein
VVDATLPQVPEVPADSLPGHVLPVVIRIPSDVVFDGRNMLTVPRHGQTAIYLPPRADPDLLAHPVIRQTEPLYRHGATNLAIESIAPLDTD